MNFRRKKNKSENASQLPQDQDTQDVIISRGDSPTESQTQIEEVEAKPVATILDSAEVTADQSESVPVYKVGRVLRQGPWMHPYPLIVGVSIVSLLVALFAANLQINRLTEELDKTDYFHAPANLSQLITQIQKSTMVVHCGESLGSGWVIELGGVVDTADEELKKLDIPYMVAAEKNDIAEMAAISGQKQVLRDATGPLKAIQAIGYNDEQVLSQLRQLSQL